MRVECYAISAITTGKPPQAVPEGTGISEKLMMSAFTPFVVPSAVESRAEQWMPEQQRDFAMSHDVSVHSLAGRLLQCG